MAVASFVLSENSPTNYGGPIGSIGATPTTLLRNTPESWLEWLPKKVLSKKLLREAYLLVNTCVFKGVLCCHHPLEC